MFGKKENINLLTDEQLVQRYLETGDNTPVGELYNRYARLVFGLSLKYLKNKDESRDILFGIFEKLLGDLKKYEIRNFKSWLYTYTRNECLMFLRKNRIHTVSADVFDLPLGIGEEEGQEEAADKEAALENLGQVVESLTEEQKVCIRMFYIENKSYNDIANETGLSFNQIKSFIQNGKRNLRIKLAAIRSHE